jgi:hypothetical protein
MADLEPSAEVIEAAAGPDSEIVKQMAQQMGAVLTENGITLSYSFLEALALEAESVYAARAALNAAGAAVERDSADVAKEVPDLGKTITGVPPTITLDVEWNDVRTDALRAEDYPVLAKIWDNEDDDIYAEQAGLASAGSTQREPTDGSRPNGALPKGLDEATEAARQYASGTVGAITSEWFVAKNAFLAGAAWREAQGVRLESA